MLSLCRLQLGRGPHVNRLHGGHGPACPGHGDGGQLCPVRGHAGHVARASLVVAVSRSTYTDLSLLLGNHLATGGHGGGDHGEDGET